MAVVRAYVWVDAWEQQCCGEPFRTGGPVAWEVNEKPDATRVVVRISPERSGRIRFAQEHHGDDPDGVLTGTVARIEAVACRREGGALVVGSGRLRQVSADVPWVPDSSDAERWMHEGWIVEVTSAVFESG